MIWRYWGYFNTETTLEALISDLEQLVGLLQRLLAKDYY